MAAEIPTTEPLSIRTGEHMAMDTQRPLRLPLKRLDTQILPQNAASHIEITATSETDLSYSVTVTAATTAAYNPGTYKWIAYVEQGVGAALVRHEIGTGTVEVLRSFASTESYDGRTHAKKVLDAIEAAIEGRATSTQLEIEIDGTRIVHMAPDQLIKWRRLSRRAQCRTGKRAHPAGPCSGRRILTRFK
ncbi:MAG: hypothetical protein MZV70_64100 [Desulfobacterales bacterium]|nr:hypothetical protein [Desulfobacterales bacterium]